MLTLYKANYVSSSKG